VSKGADHVTRQFERVHGPDGPTPDAEGKRRGTLEVPRLRRRPGDDRLKKPVGRDAPNRPDDVARLQRALSETDDYTFTAPRERSGVMSANLETALTRYQRRTGLKPDGVVAPGGPTVQQIAAEAEANVEKGFGESETFERLPASNQETEDLQKDDPTAGNPEAWEEPPSESPACQQAKVDMVNFSDNLEAARDQLQEEQKRLENVEEALREIQHGRSRGLAERAMDRLIRRVLVRLGLVGLIVYVIYKGEQIIDRAATMDKLNDRRTSLQNEVEIQKQRVQEHLKKVEDARDRKLTHCGRNVLPEGSDTISHRPGSATSEA
jgi:hypothetical protein